MKTIRIGRAADNDYIIPHPSVCDYYAVIYVYDNGSMQYMDHSPDGSVIDGALVHNTSFSLSGNENIGLPGGIKIPVSDILGKISYDSADKPTDERESHPGNTKEESKDSNSASPVEKKGMGFGETLVYFFKNYTNFSGRARRREYWFTTLWLLIFMFFFALLTPLGGVGAVGLFLLAIAVFLPSLALDVRRLHDTGKSGWLVLLQLIPYVGAIIMFVFALLDSDRGPNQYGESPKYQ